MFGNIQLGFLMLIILVFSIALHEFGHAAMSTKLGDPTPRLQGRLTLNPVAHFDPIGFIFLLLVVFAGFFFAWGRPVQTNPLYYQNYRQGIVLTALAGPLMNLSLAMFGLGAAYIIFLSGSELTGGARFFIFMWILLNVVLMCFNLLPIPPLDGGHLLQQLAPRSFAPLVKFLQQFGILVVMALIFTGAVGYIFQFILAIMFWLIGAAFGPEFSSFLRGGFV